MSGNWKRFLSNLLFGTFGSLQSKQKKTNFSPLFNIQENCTWGRPRVRSNIWILLSLYLDFSLDTHMNNHKDVPKSEPSRWLPLFTRQSWLGKRWPMGAHYSMTLTLTYTQSTQIHRVEGNDWRFSKKYVFWQLNKEAVQIQNTRGKF